MYSNQVTKKACPVMCINNTITLLSRDRGCQQIRSSLSSCLPYTTFNRCWKNRQVDMSHRDTNSNRRIYHNRVSIITSKILKSEPIRIASFPHQIYTIKKKQKTNNEKESRQV